MIPARLSIVFLVIVPDALPLRLPIDVFHMPIAGIALFGTLSARC